jgi:endonuclease YncB( thermonuclease family)
MLRLVSLAFFTAMISSPTVAQVITAPGRAIDGDTLDMSGMRVRLAGIDAPEAMQTCKRADVDWACGSEATSTLTEIIGAQQVTCTSQGLDRDSRMIAICRVRAQDIGRELVRRGLAIALDDAPEDYHEASAQARRLNYGLWASTFQLPSQWRAENPRAEPNTESRRQPVGRSSAAPNRSNTEKRHTNSLGCAIKGNRNKRGEWIYHLPGQAYYDQTRPEELFCTEREAIAAGYRRSKV